MYTSATTAWDQNVPLNANTTALAAATTGRTSTMRSRTYSTPTAAAPSTAEQVHPPGRGAERDDRHPRLVEGDVEGSRWRRHLADDAQHLPLRRVARVAGPGQQGHGVDREGRRADAQRDQGI